MEDGLRRSRVLLGSWGNGCCPSEGGRGAGGGGRGGIGSADLLLHGGGVGGRWSGRGRGPAEALFACLIDGAIELAEDRLGLREGTIRGSDSHRTTPV